MFRQPQLVAPWTLLALLAAGFNSPAAEPVKSRNVTLVSEMLTPKAPLPESPDGALQFTLMVKVDAKGEGQGQLILDPNQQKFDEVGDVIGSTKSANIQLDCSLKFVKTKKNPPVPPTGPKDDPNHPKEWFIYEIHGKKISSRLFLVAPTKELKSGRLLIQNKDGEVVSVIEMREPIKWAGPPNASP